MLYNCIVPVKYLYIPGTHCGKISKNSEEAVLNLTSPFNHCSSGPRIGTPGFVGLGSSDRIVLSLGGDDPASRHDDFSSEVSSKTETKKQNYRA